MLPAVSLPRYRQPGPPPYLLPLVHRKPNQTPSRRPQPPSQQTKSYRKHLEGRAAGRRRSAQEKKGFSGLVRSARSWGGAQLLNRPSLDTRKLLRTNAQLLKCMSLPHHPNTHTHTWKGSTLSSTSFPGTRAKTLKKKRLLRGLVPLALSFLQ